MVNTLQNGFKAKWFLLYLLTAVSFNLIIGANEKFSFPIGFLIAFSLPFSFTSEFCLLPLFVFASIGWLLYVWYKKKNNLMHNTLSVFAQAPLYIQIKFILEPTLKFGGLASYISLAIFAIFSFTLIITLVSKIIFTISLFRKNKEHISN